MRTRIPFPALLCAALAPASLPGKTSLLLMGAGGTIAAYAGVFTMTERK
jgi:hypothetical protein